MATLIDYTGGGIILSAILICILTFFDIVFLIFVMIGLIRNQQLSKGTKIAWGICWILLIFFTIYISAYIGYYFGLLELL